MQNEARGSFGTGDISREFNLARFQILQLLAKASFCTLVRVEAVTNDGGVSPIGHVNILPLVEQLDGERNAVAHAVIYNVPYQRLQGGANAVILDPQVGDIGLAAFCDRDISVVKSTQKAGPPGSNRQHHMADAVYLMSVIAQAPTQYVRFNAEGIDVVSPTKVNVQAPDITLVGNVAASGGALTHNGINVGSDHAHTGVQPGSGTSGPPVA